MTLLPSMKQLLSSPTDLIDIQDIKELKGIYESENKIIVGALTTHNEVANSSIIKKNINIPIVGIGGLNKFNIKKLIYLKPDFLAFCSSIWNTKRSPQIEIKSLKNVLDNF